MSLRTRPVAAAVAAVVAVALLLAGCTQGPDTTTQPDGGQTGASTWSYRDATGTTIRLDRRPVRVVALDDLALSFVRLGLHPVGTFGRVAPARDDRWQGLDRTGLTDVGTRSSDGTTGIDTDALAAVHPDLVVTSIRPVDDQGTLPDGDVGSGFADAAQLRQVRRIAPVAEVAWSGDGADVVAEVTRLATSLGADRSVVDAAQQRFDRAGAVLEQATKAADVTVTALYADSDGVYVARPRDHPELRLWAHHGVQLTDPPQAGYGWGVSSWPNAGKVGGDVFLLSSEGYQVAQLEQRPTIAAAPALVAGQVHRWDRAVLDPASQALAMEQLANWIGASRHL